MVKFNGIPFLQYLINHFHKFPFQNTYILAGYKGKQIFKNYNNKVVNFIKIKCFIEKEPLGTGGALNLLKKKIKNDFVLINGDSILLENLNFLFKKNFKSKKNIIFLTKNKNFKSNLKLANLSISKNKNIKFSSTKKFMNAGVYYLKKNIISKEIKKKKCSFEEDVIKKLIKKKELYGIISKNFFIDIGTPKNLVRASKLLRHFFYKKSAFFDRDGVINVDFGYVFKINNFKLLPQVTNTLKYLIKKNYYIFIITNQAGIAKRKYSLKEFFKLHKQLKYRFSQKEINFDDVQFSPYHEKALIIKYKKKTNFRKPGDGMIKQVYKKFLVNTKKSFFIGDQKKDKLAANKSNLYFEYNRLNLYKQIKQLIKKIN